MNILKYKDRVKNALIGATGVLLPICIVVADNAESLPRWLRFLTPTVKGELPLFVQFLLLDIFYFILLKAGAQPCGKYSLSVSLISMLIFSRFVVHSGWAVSEAVVITVIATALCERHGIKIRLLRGICLLLAWVMGVWSIAVSIGLIIIREICISVKGRK